MAFQPVCDLGDALEPDPHDSKQGGWRRWFIDHPVLATVAAVVVAVVLIAAIAGGSSTKTVTETVTTTQTVAHVRTRERFRTRVRTVVRRLPAPPARTVTVSSTSTVTSTAAAAAGGGGGGGTVEGPGSTSHATDAEFCSTHFCIPNFPNGNGSIVQCADGEWSHSGGLSGACSDHGGER